MPADPSAKTSRRPRETAGGDYWCDCATCTDNHACRATKREGDRRVAVGTFDDRHPADQCDHPNCVRETSARPDRRARFIQLTVSARLWK